MDDIPLSCIDVIGECPDWFERAPDLETKIQKSACVTLQAENRQGSVAILLADAERVRALNARFRSKDAPTNVLSFPAGEPLAAQAELKEMPFLGDIVLSYETVMQEATAQNKSFIDHTIHLVVHGMLHILGYDHQNETDTGIMTDREIDILARLNISNPYAAERAEGTEECSHG